MYKNVGKKIQTLAKWYGWTIFIGGVLAFFIMLGDYDFEEIWFIPLVALGGFASSWPLYGFGELVENVQKIKDKVEGNVQSPISENDELPEI